MDFDNENLEFLQSPTWLRYTHESYRSIENIRHRLAQTGVTADRINHQIDQIKKVRRVGGIPLTISSIKKQFWFFPADCILRKVHEIELAGQGLHDIISRNAAFTLDFYLDSTVEEAISSAIYEGANSTRAQAQQLITSGTPPKTRDEWMLVNNFSAMQWIKENKGKSFNTDLICDIHGIVTRNTLIGEDAAFAGKFRDDRVFVHSSRNEIKHEGIDYKKIESAVNEVIELVTNNSRYVPPLIQGILLHYFVAYIHPFFDGNGRTARALFYFTAMKNSLPFVELMSVSAYLKNYGRQYEKSFEYVVDNDLDITYFIDFNLDALLKAVTQVRAKVDFLVKIPNIKARYDLTDFQIALLQKTALHKFRQIDVESYAAEINRSREIARQELKHLFSLGFMNERREGKKYVYTISLEVLMKSVAAYG